MYIDVKKCLCNMMYINVKNVKLRGKYGLFHGTAIVTRYYMQ